MSSCGKTASPCIRSGVGGPDPNPSCTGEGKAQNRRDPSTKAGSVDPRAGTVTRLSWVTSAVIGAPAVLRSSGAVRRRSGTTPAVVTPQRDHQLARHCHDGDAADAALEVADPLAEPAAQLAFGLMAQPQPGELDRERAGTAVAGFADALLAPALAAVVRRAGQPEIAADLAAIVEGAIEYLVDQLLAADRGRCP